MGPADLPIPQIVAQPRSPGPLLFSQRLFSSQDMVIVLGKAMGFITHVLE